MHIPDSMIQGSVCPVSAAVSVGGILVSSYFAAKSEKKPKALFFAAVSSLIFAAQILNFPIMNGTSGHLIGGVFASALLGTPFGILSMALVVTIQCLIFADGGITVLGANILNMALIAAGAGGFFLFLFRRTFKLKFYSSLGLASWLSVMLAAFAVCLELAVSGSAAFTVVLVPMLGVHALIGIGEALISAALVLLLKFFEKQKNGYRWQIPVTMGTAVFMVLILSPFASAFPDGLEWVAQKTGFMNINSSAVNFVAPISEYSFPGISHSFFAVSSAGFLGIVFTALLGWCVFVLIKQLGLFSDAFGR